MALNSSRRPARVVTKVRALGASCFNDSSSFFASPLATAFMASPTPIVPTSSAPMATPPTAPSAGNTTPRPSSGASAFVAATPSAMACVVSRDSPAERPTDFETPASCVVNRRSRFVVSSIALPAVFMPELMPDESCFPAIRPVAAVLRLSCLSCLLTALSNALSCLLRSAVNCLESRTRVTLATSSLATEPHPHGCQKPL